MGVTQNSYIPHAWYITITYLVLAGYANIAVGKEKKITSVFAAH